MVNPDHADLVLWAVRWLQNTVGCGSVCRTTRLMMTMEHSEHITEANNYKHTFACGKNKGEE